MDSNKIKKEIKEAESYISAHQKSIDHYRKVIETLKKSLEEEEKKEEDQILAAKNELINLMKRKK